MTSRALRYHFSRTQCQMARQKCAGVPIHKGKCRVPPGSHMVKSATTIGRGDRLSREDQGVLAARAPSFDLTQMASRDWSPFPSGFSTGRRPSIRQRSRRGSRQGVWVIGGGDLASQFPTEGMLAEIIVSIAPFLLGSGRPLFTRPYDLELNELDRNRAFACARYRVVGPRSTR